MFNQEKWQKMPLCLQMANIASEITKAFYRKAQKDKTALEAANSALLLFDLTIQRASGHALSEILKIRSVFCDAFFDFKQFNVSFEGIKAYFLLFVLQARAKT